jgi:hypothetical protein
MQAWLFRRSALRRYRRAMKLAELRLVWQIRPSISSRRVIPAQSFDLISLDMSSQARMPFMSNLGYSWTRNISSEGSLNPTGWACLLWPELKGRLGAGWLLSFLDLRRNLYAYDLSMPPYCTEASCQLLLIHTRVCTEGRPRDGRNACQ